MKRHVEVRTEPTSTKRERKDEMPVSRHMTPARDSRGVMGAFDEMERWMEETMHRPFLFDTGFRPFTRLFHDLGLRGEVMPSIDIFSEGNEIVVKAELPGIRREDINVKLSDHDLTIYGEKKSEEKIERKDFLRLERSYGSFSRTVRLPEGVETDKITASYKDGVLEVRMPGEGGRDVKTITIE